MINFYHVDRNVHMYQSRLPTLVSSTPPEKVSDENFCIVSNVYPQHTLETTFQIVISLGMALSLLKFLTKLYVA